jgi:hypothetical protein
MGNTWLCQNVIILLAILLYTLLYSVSGALTPQGIVSLACGAQQAFTCSGEWEDYSVYWTLHGLHGIGGNHSRGYSLAIQNERITSPDWKNRTSSSTITIIGFTADDNGGTVQCTYYDGNNMYRHSNVTVLIGEGVTIHY